MVNGISVPLYTGLALWRVLVFCKYVRAGVIHVNGCELTMCMRVYVCCLYSGRGMFE